MRCEFIFKERLHLKCARLANATTGWYTNKRSTIIQEGTRYPDG
jgi:hypothetical protein